MTTGTEQPHPNTLELAILQAMIRERPSLVVDVGSLCVQSRRYTGVGSYTDFVCDESGEQRLVKLKARIAVPGVPNGMGAVLYCRGERPQCLEMFTYGDDYWKGTFEGFSVG